MTAFRSKLRNHVLGCVIWLSPLAGWAAAEEPRAKLVLQLPYTHQFQFAGIYAAQTQGYFREEGLEVEVRQNTYGLLPLREMKNGKAQYGVDQSLRVLRSRLEGEPVVVLTVIFQHSPYALAVKRGSGIHNPQDLIGKRVALESNFRSFELSKMLALEGLDAGKVTVVPNRWEVNELLTGEADAMGVFATDSPYDLKLQGCEVQLIRPSDYGVDFYGDCLVTTEQELRDNPERAAAMRRAVLRGWTYALKHQEELMAWILTGLPEVPKRVTLERLRFEAPEIARLVNPELIEHGSTNPGRWRTTMDMMIAAGVKLDPARLHGLLYQPEESRPFPLWGRWLLGGAALLLLASGVMLLANRRLQQLVDRRTQQLRESQQRQREIFDLAPTPITIEDYTECVAALETLRRNGMQDLREHLRRHPEKVRELHRLKRIIDANRLTLQRTGYQTVAELNARFREIMTEQAYANCAEEMVALWEGRDRLSLETHYQMRDGEVRHTLLSWQVPRKDGKRDLANVQLVFTDISEIRRAEQFARESEERYRMLFETTPNPMYIFDTETLRIVTVNAAAVARYGYSRQEFERMSVLDLRPPEEAVRLRRAMEDFRTSPTAPSSGARAAGLWRHRCKDGTVLIVEVFTHSLVFNNRPCVLSLPFDITAKLAAERALRDSESRYRDLFENAVGGVYRSTPDGRFISVNPAMARLYGFDTPAEMLAWNEREHGGAAYVQEEEHRRFIELIERHGKVENHESRIIDRHGNTLWVAETSRAVRDTDGRLLYYEGFVTDITARRRLETEMLRSSKLEAVGILAGGIAHDFNNILTVVLGNVTLAEMDSANDSSVRRMLHDAKRATLRARDLTQQLLTFAKGGDPVRAAVALPDLLKESAEFAMHGAKSRCEFDLDPELWPANADKGQLGQVVQNLVINAVQAMPQGGIVRIAAGNCAVPSGALGNLSAGDYVKISVSDTGTGIAPEHLAKIFDPYFTTKQQGSGLGLATVYSIARKHGGHIEVESKLGVGTTFHLWLPAAAQAVKPAQVESLPDGELRVRVLFMDDEEPIREMANLFLSRLGSEVTTAADGASAVEAYRTAMTAGRPYDVVVMDLTVPGGMGGRDAMQHLLKLDPKVRAIVSSGYSRDPVLGSYRAHGFSGILPKPYGLDQLRKAIAGVSKPRNGSGAPF